MMRLRRRRTHVVIEDRIMGKKNYHDDLKVFKLNRWFTPDEYSGRSEFFHAIKDGANDLFTLTKEANEKIKALEEVINEKAPELEHITQEAVEYTARCYAAYDFLEDYSSWAIKELRDIIDGNLDDPYFSKDSEIDKEERKEIMLKQIADHLEYGAETILDPDF